MMCQVSKPQQKKSQKYSYGLFMFLNSSEKSKKKKKSHVVWNIPLIKKPTKKYGVMFSLSCIPILIEKLQKNDVTPGKQKKYGDGASEKKKRKNGDDHSKKIQKNIGGSMCLILL